MISEREGRLYVTGAMTQQTVPELLTEGERFITAGLRAISLEEVTSVDSSALALVLAWLRAARAASGSLEISDAPAAFMSLASLYGVDEILFPGQAHQL